FKHNTEYAMQRSLVGSEMCIRDSPGSDEGDYQVKLRSLIRFLEDGDKAKICLLYTSPSPRDYAA
ncbi:hypothetical protein ELK71_28240, partial [Klebsiella pneumoniae]|nr:hypothetical protein [Klebsiella pneumoniae]